MKITEALDELFKDVIFDEKLLRELIKVNVNFITANQEIRDMMGSKLVGCFNVSYTQLNKDWFYKDLFGFTYDDAVNAIKKIDSFPKTFIVARDDINLITYYMAHRFLNSKMSKSLKMEGARESLIYFGYRTIVTLNANWWKYPIPRATAVSLSESLSRKYLIIKLKNWNQYAHYRADEYLKSKYLDLLTKMNKDIDVPNAIVDIYGRYVKTFKTIYGEFERLEANNILKSNNNIVNDAEGQQVLLDRIDSPSRYTDKVMAKVGNKSDFIRGDIVELSCSIVTAISQDQLTECLELTLDYYYKSVNNAKEVGSFVEDFIADSIEYLQDKKLFLNNGSNVIDVVNMIVGNILYSRGTNISITEVKNRGEALIKHVYKFGKVQISNRNLTAMRNVFCVYILLVSLL